MKIVPFLSLAPVGGIHGSGANISGLYLVLVIVTMMNFFSLSLWADTECFNVFSFRIISKSFTHIVLFQSSFNSDRILAVSSSCH